MSTNTTTDDTFEVVPFLKMLWRWKAVIIGATAVAFLAAFLISKMLTPLFESHTLLYPTNSSNRDKQLEGFAFGYESHSEQLMQLLQSDMIMDSINRKFNLATHYEIDLDEIDWYDEFIKKAHERIQYHKTQYYSVVVSVIDHDPKLAADIANEIARLVNVISGEIVKANAKKVLETVEREYEARRGNVSVINDSIFRVREGLIGRAEGNLRKEIKLKEARIRVIRDSLDAIRKRHNFHDYTTQVNILNEQLAEARSVFLQESGNLEVYGENGAVADSVRMRAEARKTGAEKRVKYFQEQLESLSGINARYMALTDQLDEENSLLAETRLRLEEMSQTLEPKVDARNLLTLEADYDWDRIQSLELKRKYQRALSNYIEPAPMAYVISKARPSYKKIYPNTKLNVILSTLGVFFFSIVAVTFIEKIRGHNAAK